MADTTGGTTAGAEALLAQIEATRVRLRAEEARAGQLDAEVRQAEERQRLRRVLDEEVSKLQEAEEDNEDRVLYQRDVDDDEEGPYLYRIPGVTRQYPTGFPTPTDASAGECVNFAHRISKGEFVWRISGMSWLDSELWHSNETFIVSEAELEVGTSILFRFAYNPHAGHVGEKDGWPQNGTLAIRHSGHIRLALRYKIYIQAGDGSFVQWSAGKGLYSPAYSPSHFPTAEAEAFGPDVRWDWGYSNPDPIPTMGIFGLTHQQLLESQWVQEDSLTVKFVLEVRPAYTSDTATVPRLSERGDPLILAKMVPEQTLSQDMRALWEGGLGSDVDFMVEGQVVKAHSQILCARSHVFEKQLTVGLRESVSKVIVIEDCEPEIFKAFLQFLYTDDLTGVKHRIEQSIGEIANKGKAELSKTQGLLAVSHKYEVTRLQLWCEMRLCEELSTSNVCGILSQAHLLQAKELERACLSVIKKQMAEVVKLPEYADLMRSCPEVMLKISLFSAGVPDTEAAAAMDAYATRRRDHHCQQEPWRSSEGRAIS